MELSRLLNGPEASLAEVLDARERRAARQEEMLENGCALVSFTLNMPGPVKQFPLAKAFFGRVLERLERALARRRFAVVRKECYFEPAGSEAFLSVAAPALEVKRVACALEISSPASRLYDMDVLTGAGVKIERAEVGQPPRTCLLCGRPVMDCAPRRVHSAEELARAAVSLMYEDELNAFSSRVAAEAQRALLYEVCVTPKPGLVDRLNNGSHADMDVFTFIDSACALAPYFARCARLGAEYPESAPKELFRALRLPGMEAEEAMYAATGGVNTHKGAIFTVGLFCAARGRLWALGQPAAAEELARVAAQMAEDARGELSQGDTAGQKIYRESGVAGIRGEGAAGFPSVIKKALPQFRSLLGGGESLNDAAALTLLRLIRDVDDTNMIRRSSLERFRQVQAQIAARLEREPAPTPAEIAAIDRAFIAENLSPGGCADLLALTLLLHFLSDFENETASWSAAGPDKRS
ncbi:MAG: citrate lyase holo-[acyl-carrier protein] synthase [Pyramidobacter sp.]|nr:citrate lyase holo-[acyl-carrier protein] synthase [Pyramidobacter sp.]